MEGNAGALRFPRRYRLGKNKNYRTVYRRGKSCPSRNISLVYQKTRDLKLGFSVSSRVGNAVVRNRVRRWMREDARLLRSELKRGRYIFVARPSAAQVPHAALTREMRYLLGREGLFRQEEQA